MEETSEGQEQAGGGMLVRTDSPLCSCYHLHSSHLNNEGLRLGTQGRTRVLVPSTQTPIPMSVGEFV